MPLENLPHNPVPGNESSLGAASPPTSFPSQPAAAAFPSAPPDPNQGPSPADPNASLPDPASGGPQNLGPDDSPTPIPGAPGAPPASPPAWAARLQQAGIDPSQFRSEEDLVSAYLESRGRLNEIEPYANYGQQFLPYAQQFGDFLRGQHSPAPTGQPSPNEPAPAAPKDVDAILREHWNSMWNPPEYDPSWENMVRINPETGMYEGLNPYVPAQVVQGMNAHRDWQRKSLNKMLTDPFEMQWQAMRPGIEEVARKLVQEEIASRKVQEDFEALENQYASVLFEHDQAGRRINDPFTGQPKFTPFGDHVLSEMRRLQASGVTDPFASFDYAVASAKAMLYDRNFQQAPPQQVPQQVPMQPQQPMPQGYPPQYQQAPSPQPPMPPAAPQSMYSALPTGMNGQMPMGGGFLPAPPASFLDRARQVNIAPQQQTPYGDPESQQEPFSTEDFFTRSAIRAGMISQN